MSKNDFVLVFQYDEDQAGTRSPDKRIPRMLEAQGGSLDSVDEAYGQVDVTCKFSGTPEQASKLVAEVLNSYSNNVKMSYITSQKVYNVVIEKGNVENEDFQKSLRDLVRGSPLSKISQHEYNKEDIVVSFAFKNDFEQLKAPIAELSKKFLSESNVYDEVSSRVLAEGNNYTDKKKYGM